ncbi:MAG: pyrroline-5-carboxylate reductase [Nitrospirota bacterium]|nr:pyrroline-5-carboxylate reductase [Nitrospirota bacterium]
MAIDKKIAFLGGGNMAEALIKGLVVADEAHVQNITVTDVHQSRLDLLRRTFGVTVTQSNSDAVKAADIVILSVKPQVMDAVLADISQAADSSKLVISIAAGVTLERIEKGLARGPRVIRVMPNTPALVLAGAAGIAAGKTATQPDMLMAKEIFGSVGRAVEVNEKLMDAVTGLSGSGPAYVFTMIEALADGGVKVGIPRALALELAAQTVFGSAKMVLETKEHPAKLRDMVASPGGTTIAGMHELEKGKLRATLISAVEAATKRGMELGGKTVSPRREQRKKMTAKRGRSAKRK